MTEKNIEIPFDKIEAFCKKWKIKEFSFFGSVLRDDFDPQKSDLDILYLFSDDALWGFEIVEMKEELEEIFNRRVDFVSKQAIENSKNPYRKQQILDSYEVIYEQSA
jgi:predicted nucleotidyltransferase